MAKSGNLKVTPTIHVSTSTQAKIRTEGGSSFGKWKISIDGIADVDLHTVETKILRMFGQVKSKKA